MRLLLLLSFIGITVAFFHGGQRHRHGIVAKKSDAKGIAANWFRALTNAAKSSNMPVLKKLVDLPVKSDTEEVIEVFVGEIIEGSTLEVLNAVVPDYFGTIEVTYVIDIKDRGERVMGVLVLKKDADSPTGYKMVKAIGTDSLEA